MTRTTAIALLVLLASAAATPGPAPAQMLDARRLAMGGVATSDIGSARTANIAFRAVPKGKSTTSIPLPLGLIQYFSDPPEFDTDDPSFNLFEILNLASNPPLTLSLSEPDEVSGDIRVFVARDSLIVDLDDVRRVIPDEPWRHGGVSHLMAVGLGFGQFFAQVVPTIHYRNEFDLDDRLRGALREAEPFTSNTRYGVDDDGVAQAAVAFQAGLSFRPLYRLPGAGGAEGEDDPDAGDPRRNGATALYLGAAPKYFMGLAYASVRGLGGITTGDTLFGSGDPVAIDMSAVTRTSGGIGNGYGADLGGVLFIKNFELGIGVNDAGSEITWNADVKQHVYSDSLNEFNTTSLGRDVEVKSRIPAALTVNVAKRSGAMTLAADFVETELKTMIHMGVERWLGNIAVRGGMYRDSSGRWQFTGGSGVKLGRLGVDLAVATHSRNVEEERAAEMCASLTLY